MSDRMGKGGGEVNMGEWAAEERRGVLWSEPTLTFAVVMKGILSREGEDGGLDWRDTQRLRRRKRSRRSKCLPQFLLHRSSYLL